MDNEYEDVKFSCVGCGSQVRWTAGEQKFLQNLIDDGKTNQDGTPITFTQPKRCKECRIKRKEEMEKRKRNNDDY